MHIDPYALQATLALIILAIAGLVGVVIADLANDPRIKRRRRR